MVHRRPVSPLVYLAEDSEPGPERPRRAPGPEFWAVALLFLPLASVLMLYALGDYAGILGLDAAGVALVAAAGLYFVPSVRAMDRDVRTRWAAVGAVLAVSATGLWVAVMISYAFATGCGDGDCGMR
jgi:hypothetical protein